MLETAGNISFYDYSVSLSRTIFFMAVICSKKLRDISNRENKIKIHGTNLQPFSVKQTSNETQQ